MREDRVIVQNMYFQCREGIGVATGHGLEERASSGPLRKPTEKICSLWQLYSEIRLILMPAILDSS